MIEQLKLENQLCHRLYMATNAVTRAYRPHLDKLGITYPQYIVMMALWENDAIEVGDLKQKTQIDGGALSLILKKLTGKQLIRSEPSATDKRVKQIYLTESGRALELAAAEIPKQLLCQFGDTDSQQLQHLKVLLDTVITRLAK